MTQFQNNTYRKQVSFVTLAIIVIMLPCMVSADNSITIAERTILSTNGSTRATAYGMSNKIITADGKLFVAWLDHVADIKIRELDLATGKWDETVHVGSGADNHSGPALTMDREGYLHIVYGTHHHPFQYRKSTRPYDSREWSDIEHFGAKGTYPSLICAPDNTLYCTFRSSATDPWRLLMHKKFPGKIWSGPTTVVDVGYKGYAWLGNTITVNPHGVIHLAFCLYDQRPPKGRGKAAGYLKSDDGGKTWKNFKGESLGIPVSYESDCYVEKNPEFDLRAKSLVLDDTGAPWFSVPHFERSPKSVVLWHLSGNDWKPVDLLPHLIEAIPGMELVDSTLSFDREGVLYAACNMKDFIPGDTSHFGHKTEETVLLYSHDKGETFEVLQLSVPDPNLPNWLPSIERPYGKNPIGTPSILYTHGGPGTGLKDGTGTEVVIVRLKESEEE